MIQCKKFVRSSKFIDNHIADSINEWLADHKDIRLINITVSLTDEILIFFEEDDIVTKLKSEIREMNILIFDMFHHACAVSYDHGTKQSKYSTDFHSVYERALAYLIKIKKISEHDYE